MEDVLLMEDDLKMTEEQLKMPNVTMGLQTLTKKKYVLCLENDL